MKLFLIGILGTVVAVCADQKGPAKKGSLIDSDPNVIYVADLVPVDEKVELTLTGPAHVYATKTGGRKLGALREGTVELIGFDDRAVKVKGQGKIGWIKPSLLKAEKGNIQELLKTVYARQTEVKALIEKGEVALGMSRDEVCQVLGEPTKQTIRRTKEGLSGSMEFTEYEEIRHFQPVVSPNTGRLFRQFTHTTQEEKSKTIVEFENEVVTAIEESEQENGGDVRVVIRPVAWIF